MDDFYQGRAWIELDRAALRRNVERLSALLPPGCILMPAVKANAYGHGAVLIARELNKMGIDAFCVATVFEGVELRQNGVLGEILILGYTHPQYAPLIAQYHLTQTIADHVHALELNACGLSIKAHIKIDTGMHRLGERYENLSELRQIFNCGYLQITGAYTHLYEDDMTSPADRAAALKQGKFLAQTVECLKSQGYVIPQIHILASEGLLHYPELGGNYARVGIALYDRVLSLKARIAQVKDVFPGEGAGYGHQFKAERSTKIAVATIGYADGLPRSLSNGVGAALVRGYMAPIAGRICMDQTLLDVTDVPDVTSKDFAVFIGRSGNQEITPQNLAQQTGTIPNELLSRLGPRLERRLT